MAFQILNSLARSFYLSRDQNRREFKISGFDSALPMAFLLSSELPTELTQKHVLVFSTESEVTDFERDLEFFAPETSCHRLATFDVSPYSGLFPNPSLVAKRTGWLARLNDQRLSPVNNVFAASVEALTQRTIPKHIFEKYSFKLLKNQEIPRTLSERLISLGYRSAPLVEDIGTFAFRGSVFDIWPVSYQMPIRFDLFGDSIEAVRFFDPASQRSSEQSPIDVLIAPAKEVLFFDEFREAAAKKYREFSERTVTELEHREAAKEVLRSLALGQSFPGVDFLIADFYQDFETPLNYLNDKHLLWALNPIGLSQKSDELVAELKREHSATKGQSICPEPDLLRRDFDTLKAEISSAIVYASRVQISDAPDSEPEDLEGNQEPTDLHFSTLRVNFTKDDRQQGINQELLTRISAWLASDQTVVIAAGTQAQARRLAANLEHASFRPQVVEHFPTKSEKSELFIVEHPLSESLRFPSEQTVFLRDEDLFGRKTARRSKTSESQNFLETVALLNFSDLEVGDRIVHVQHGIGVYEGLKRMKINDIESEFLALSYKEGDKLYLPIYRISQIQKYSGPGSESILDRLGGTAWSKTKSKVRNQIREIAGDLLKLYAQRSQLHRKPFSTDPNSLEEFSNFESAFPYDETQDQLKAIEAINKDLSGSSPMDRLVCGDVGFGKTEVAMRAAFRAVQDRMQVLVLAPTTVLSFQHLETFHRRFKGWPITIKALNRFVPPATQRQTLVDLKEGRVDILIGTHRVLSKDVEFKNLGLMIIDEEQRFGVTHKEKIRKVKVGVDTLTLSATPIPRTLNMSLVGIRDLSLINTPPIDRLPTRTFVCKFDEETIRRGILSEMQRGGQVFFLHNRVQSIYSIADQIRTLVPEARLRVGHGQMAEHELEETMIAFFNHEIDVLLSTTIIESGIDNPRANTMFIDNAHQLGLSQLYQLRGRVGRSKERAYCYLLIPPTKKIETDAQERLKVIQENTALGSGITIAHHDLELRGAGNFLGEEQSGHIEAVGYEMYLELLEETIRELKGEEIIEKIEPEITLRIPALIPDYYVPDLRIRLAWYRNLTQIQTAEDVDRMEEQISDQFGRPPEEVLNLLGLMLIRAECRKLGIRDLSQGTKSVSLAFTPQTPLPPQEVVRMATRMKEKYSLSPDMRLTVRLQDLSWPKIYEELLELEKLCPI